MLGAVTLTNPPQTAMFNAPSLAAIAPQSNLFPPKTISYRLGRVRVASSDWNWSTLAADTFIKR